MAKSLLGAARSPTKTASAISTLAAKSDSVENAISSSPLDANTWNSCEAEPPIEPVSAWTGRKSKPRRVKMRL